MGEEREPTTEALVRAAQAGDREALNRLLRGLLEVWPKRKILWAVTNGEDRKEILQEACLRVTKSLSQANPTTFDGWAFTILKNRVLEHFRSTAQGPVALAGDAPELVRQSVRGFEREDSSEDWQDLFLRVDFRHSVGGRPFSHLDGPTRDALDRLDRVRPDQAEIVYLKDVVGYGYGEIRTMFESAGRPVTLEVLRQWHSRGIAWLAKDETLIRSNPAIAKLLQLANEFKQAAEVLTDDEHELAEALWPISAERPSAEGLAAELGIAVAELHRRAVAIKSRLAEVLILTCGWTTAKVNHHLRIHELREQQ